MSAAYLGPGTGFGKYFIVIYVHKNHSARRCLADRETRKELVQRANRKGKRESTNDWREIRKKEDFHD